MKNESKSIYFTDTVGGHIALDLLNTVSMVNGHLVDSMQSDADVLTWLQGYSSILGIDNNQSSFSGLLERARWLREAVRELIMERKEDKPLDIDAINAFLRKGASYIQLVSIGANKYCTKIIRSVDSAEELLAPVAEAAVELLTMENFNLIRKCESAECVLWFYDRTKGHKRRWCSMAICGNRHKVSNFRARQSTT